VNYYADTELGTLNFTIHDEQQGSLSFCEQVFVNRIPYKVEGRWEVYEPYGRNEEGRWAKTGKLAIRLDGYMPMRRLDRSMFEDEPTPKAAAKVEKVVTEAILPVLEREIQNGNAKRMRLENEIRRLGYSLETDRATLERVKEDIRQKEQEMERVKAEIAEVDLQIFHMSD
jgi:hypothetical protein